MASTLAARTAFQTTPPKHAGLCAAQAQPRQRAGVACSASRREALLGASCALTTAVLSSGPALAFSSPPGGYTRHLDRLDGYSFFYPDSWQIVTTSGNDVFYRNPRIADENVFVDLSSPSSSRYESVSQLGTPEQASKRVIRQLEKESMSTRLGVRREFETLSATERVASFSEAAGKGPLVHIANLTAQVLNAPGEDGQLYYDIVSRVKSFASRQQLAVNVAEREEAIVMEYDRVLINTLGTANKRLYQLRIQTPYSRYTKEGVSYATMLDSFRTKEVVL